MTKELSQDQLLAAPLVGGVWTAIRSVGGPRPNTGDYHLLRRLFDPDWLQTLPLPVGEARPVGQTVALAEPTSFQRPSTSDELARAYADLPRTRIYESIDARSGGWPEEATRFLRKLARCAVTCTVYESCAGDMTLGPHRDRWYGAIVQQAGTKAWLLGQDATNKPQPETPTEITEPGDLLLLPQGLPHDVRTPEHSLHVGFAFITDEPMG